MPKTPTVDYIIYMSQVLVFLSRRSNFDTRDYSEYFGLKRSAAQRHLRSLEEAGMVELVVGLAHYQVGGNVWRSLVKVEYRTPLHARSSIG